MRLGRSGRSSVLSLLHGQATNPADSPGPAATYILLALVLGLLAPLSAYAQTCPDRTDQICSPPVVTDWTYNRVGTSISASLKSQLSVFGCVTNYAPSTGWTSFNLSNPLTIFNGSGSEVANRNEIQLLTLTTSQNETCQNQLSNLLYYGNITQLADYRYRTIGCRLPNGDLANPDTRRFTFGYAAVCASWKPLKTVVIDPGHGLACAAIGQAVGAVGVTDFPSNDPPPGKLREDYLTMAIALELERILSASQYKVIMTKRDVNACPSFKDRGRTANQNKADVFVSIHINKQNTIMGFEVPFANGTSVLYHPSRLDSKVLADQMAGSVSSNLGVNNRGSFTKDDIAVLKPRVTEMTAVLVEAARLSGTDEKILHTSGSAAKVATGIKAALDAFVRK